MSSPRLLVVAGEVSGDMHAGNLLGELNARVSGLSAFGIGGDRLVANGLEALAGTDELAHMGLVEVFRELPRIRRIMNDLVDAAAERRPTVAILVDSPDFNLRLAKRLRRLGIPVVLYVSPQLWAWRQGRVRTVRTVADEVLCILPFEVDFYHQHRVPARYVGHPLVDEIARVGLLESPATVREKRLAMMPGSRSMEVGQLLPVMVRALAMMPRDEVREAVLIEAPGMEGAIDQVLRESPGDHRLRRIGGDARRQALAESAVAWTASGTATLECALLDVPMVVGYRLKPLSFALAKMLVRVPNVALVNLIAGETLVPELLQNDWNAGAVSGSARRIMAEAGASQRAGLKQVRQRLGPPGASRNAAAAVSEYFTS